MHLLGAPLFAALLPFVRSSKIPDALDCHNPEETGDVDECAQPIANVTAIVPGSSYIAKIECKDCPFVVPGDDKLGSTDYLFLLNITLTHDNRTVLLNNRPLYPLQTIPTPPPFDAAQYIPDLSNTDLYRGLTSSDPYCKYSTQKNIESAEWCWKIPLWPHTRPGFDYLYISESTQYNVDDDQDNAEYWNISLDLIGKSLYQENPLWEYDHPEQKMLWMLIKGTPLETRKGNTGQNKAADPFNGQYDTQNKKYEYQIVDMRLTARAYTFPAKKTLSLWGRIGHFFGNDVWEEQGSRFLYRQEEWGQYGKKGTLRNMFGEFLHWDFWSLFWIVFFSVVGGLLALFGFYKLFRWIVAQRELMKWDGMENVWENMRRERLAEEEGALLHGETRYTDDPDEGSSSRPPAYEDAMKPLPSKPLPEKPLPEVPLIEA